MRTGPGVLIVLVALVPLCGCGHRAAPPKPVAKPAAAVKAGTPLPGWAPKSPSPEFLRAWKVLKPAPIESMMNEVKSDREMSAARARVIAAWPAHYELFGTLTDDQIQRFLRTREIRIPAKDLTSKQHATLENFFREWRQDMKGTKYPDFLVLLYQFGAKEDFSNVDVGFDTGEKSHWVQVKFWIKLPDGSVIQPCNGFAVI